MDTEHALTDRSSPPVRVLVAGVNKHIDFSAQIASLRRVGCVLVVNVFGVAQVDSRDPSEDVALVSFDSSLTQDVDEFLRRDGVGYDVIVCPPGATGLNADTLHRLLRGTPGVRPLRALACAAASTRHLRHLLAAIPDLPVVTVADAHRDAVAEYTLLQMGLHARQIDRWATLTGPGEPFSHDLAAATTQLLTGKTLGVLGVAGRDGSAVADLAIRMSVRVIAESRGDVKDAIARRRGITVLPTREEVYRQSDYLSINVSWSPETSGIVTARDFATMKPGVVIVNPSGAETFDRHDLLNELAKPATTRRVAAVILDMPYGNRRDESAFGADPINAQLRAIGAVFTPRMSGYTLDSVLESNRIMMRHIEAFCASAPSFYVSSRVNLTQLHDTLCEAVMTAGFTVCSRHAETFQISYKLDGSPVTEMDALSEGIIRDVLRLSGFDFVFQGEEISESLNSPDDFVLVADGIDGTRNYRDGNYGWCVSAAVLRRGETMCAAVYDPVTDTMFSAMRGRGALTRVRGAEAKPLMTPGSVPRDFSFSIGSFFVRKNRRFRQQLADAMKDLGGRGREWGSVALSICAVARGGLGAFVQCRSQVHDHAAAVFIATGAGATVFTDEAETSDRVDVIVCHPSLAPSVREAYLSCRRGIAEDEIGEPMA